MNLLLELPYFFARKILPGFKIRKKSLVLDIGSGDKPFWRADVYVDNLFLGNEQRATGTKTIHDVGTFINGDVLNLPFKDKSFDFSFASHLLEHVENPAQAIKEITRVSKGGYIEVPNGIIETVRPFGSHLWFVYLNKNKLIFVRKSKTMHEVLLENGKKYNAVTDMILNPFIRMYWKKNINYEIIDTYKANEKFYTKPTNKSLKSLNKRNWYIIFVKLLRFFFYTNKHVPKEIFKPIKKSR